MTEKESARQRLVLAHKALTQAASNIKLLQELLENGGPIEETLLATQIQLSSAAKHLAEFGSLKLDPVSREQERQARGH